MTKRAREEDPRDKRLGAYYTDSQVAEFLTRWAIRNAEDTVADPSFGGGVFLRAAAKRVLSLGGAPSRSVSGVEIDEEAYASISRKLTSEFGIPTDRLIHDDFFGLPSGALAVDAIVGNPPFIRFHNFAGESRRRALARASAIGVELSGASSSWAPVLVHAAGMLNSGGRLGMVVPAEIGYAEYAGPVVRFLCDRFGAVTLITFETSLFPHLSEDTYLLLAEGYGRGRSESLRTEDYPDIGALLRGQAVEAVALDPEALIARSQRFAESFLPESVRRVYDRLATDGERLRTYAEVGIGYVSGANEFFHLTDEKARTKGIGREFLKPSLLNGRSLARGIIRDRDWEVAEGEGAAGLLLHLAKGARLSGAVSEYLEEGIARDVPKGYKCRMRTPWYGVPGVHTPDAFLTSMSGHRPRFSVNEGGFVAPNTLHTLRLKFGSTLDARDLLVWWHSAPARLGVGLEGHALGGGMLKIEPREAGRLLVPKGISGIGRKAEELDRLLHAGRGQEADRLADEAVSAAAGIDARDMRWIDEGAEILRRRRMRNGR